MWTVESFIRYCQTSGMSSTAKCNEVDHGQEYQEHQSAYLVHSHQANYSYYSSLKSAQSTMIRIAMAKTRLFSRLPNSIITFLRHQSRISKFKCRSARLGPQDWNSIFRASYSTLRLLNFKIWLLQSTVSMRYNCTWKGFKYLWWYYWYWQLWNWMDPTSLKV